MNKVRVTICGTDYSTSTDDTPEYMSLLSKAAENDIYSLTASSKGFGVQSAAVFQSMVNLDRAARAERSLNKLCGEAERRCGELSRAKSECASSHKKAKRLEARLAVVCRERNELSHELEQYKDKLSDEESKTEKLSLELARARAECAASKKKTAELESRLGTACRENAVLAEQSERFAGEVGKSSDGLKILAAEKAQLSKKVRMLSSRLSDAEAETEKIAAAAQSEISSLKAKNLILEGKVKLYEARTPKIGNTSVKASGTDAGGEKLAERIAELDKRIRALESENRILKNRPDFKGEQLVLENTVSPAVTVPIGREYIYSDGNTEARKRNMNRRNDPAGLPQSADDEVLPQGSNSLPDNEEPERQLPGQFSLIDSDDGNVCLYEAEKPDSKSRRRNNRGNKKSR